MALILASSSLAMGLICHRWQSRHHDGLVWFDFVIVYYPCGWRTAMQSGTITLLFDCRSHTPKPA